MITSSNPTAQHPVSFACIIMAAGKGTRMLSATPKCMHPVANKPILKHVIDTCVTAGATEIVVVLSPDDPVSKTQVPPHTIAWQHEARGTGHAAQLGVQALQAKHDKILIVNADMPLLLAETIRDFAHNPDPMTIMVMDLPDPRKFGRVITDSNQHVQKIVEFKDATDAERAVTLCNTGVYAIRHDQADAVLNRIDNHNAAQEYYLTDIVAIGKTMGLSCGIMRANWDEVASCNTRPELAELEALMQTRLRTKFLNSGVTLIDPNTVYFSADTQIAQDVVIEPNVFIGPGVTIGKQVRIKAFSHIEGAELKDGVQVGPFARIRPETVLSENVRVGNFVEIKKAVIGKGTKINHLTYIGDATIGASVNVGAFTVTCNYDGFKKFETMVGDNVLIGSHSVLVAPVTVGQNAITAAGSVITQDVPVDALAITRPEQKNLALAAKRFRDKRQANKH